MEQVVLRFEVCPADLDEPIAKRSAEREGWSPARLALHLAAAKACMVSSRRPGCLVVGADQVLSSGACRFDKPASLEEARSQLGRLRGTEQVLDTATVIVEDGEVVWESLAAPKLKMRAFSDAVLDLYVLAEGAALLSCVGACRVEGVGRMLFERIDGDQDAILGLPILPLLHELRRRGVLMD